MARTARNSSSEAILQKSRTFFVTTKTSLGRRLFQVDRNAELFVQVLRSLVSEHVFRLHDFVVMPDHVHLLMSVDEGRSIEKAMQMVKGRFSRRLSQEFGHGGEVWQAGFHEVQVIGNENFNSHRRYIAENPVKSGLAETLDEYPYCFRNLARKKTEAMLSRG